MAAILSRGEKGSVQYVPGCRIVNKAALVVMDWHRAGDKPLPKKKNYIYRYMRHQTTLY